MARFGSNDTAIAVICLLACSCSAFVPNYGPKNLAEISSRRTTSLYAAEESPSESPSESTTDSNAPGSNVRTDMMIAFGSDDDNLEDEDEEDYYEKQEIENQAKRDEIVNQKLKEQDQEFKEERRRQVWGDFADAKTAEDIEKVKLALKEKIDKENEFKTTLAKSQGVDLEVLEAPESDGSFFDTSSDTVTMIRSGKSWFESLDADLKQEWAAMGDDKAKSDMESNDDDDDDEEEEPDSLLASATDDTAAVDGKIVSRDTLKGVRVGSAGGWSLEIFPGDFVVHRKYGIGRFEKTCTTPRLKLTREEVKARDARRKEIITEKLRETKGGIPQEMIQQMQASFGTELDTDPVSNPQVTVLEITYSDGIVHVPVDRAYRLSRYRAGDAVVKPRLSKVRGDQWRNARKKVEASTLELAQDVLALYATRETLQRKPFDPDNEFKVKEFEKTFKFEPTKDQVKCFEDVENDMVWRPRPMDRLICGDVG